MKNLVKKVLLAGLGTIILTKEKATEIANDLIKQGDLSEKEGKKFVDELLLKSKEGQAEIAKILEKVLKNSKVATNEDVERIEKKLDQIIKLLQK